MPFGYEEYKKWIIHSESSWLKKPVPELASQADAGIVPAFFCEKVADTTGAGASIRKCGDYVGNLPERRAAL